MALERVAPERRRQERRARRVIEVHPTAEWLRAVAEEASATPPPHQEQRGRPGSARELANFEANLARVRPPAGPNSVETRHFNARNLLWRHEFDEISKSRGFNP